MTSITSRLTIAAVVGLLGVLALAPPSHAVVGGSPVSPATYPWFVQLAGCGSVLVAPDRLLTAAHCVSHQSVDQLVNLPKDKHPPRAVAFALTPSWRVRNAGNHRDDIAIVRLARPLTDRPLVAVAQEPPTTNLTLLGGGLTTVKAGRTGDGLAGLRRTHLKPITDAECAESYAGHPGNSGERFIAGPMLCATDPNGGSPFASGCLGDSGGPLFGGGAAAPVIYGVVSWGGDGCGADRRPSVFADVSAFRDFIFAPAPVWAPVPTEPATVHGDPRVGSTLSCDAAGAPTKAERVAVTWRSSGKRGLHVLGRGSRYHVRKVDAGRVLSCFLEASGPGGVGRAPIEARSFIKIARAR
jgi:secreted trypsin-like serine protease